MNLTYLLQLLLLKRKNWYCREETCSFDSIETVKERWEIILVTGYKLKIELVKYEIVLKCTGNST